MGGLTFGLMRSVGGRILVAEGVCMCATWVGFIHRL